MQNEIITVMALCILRRITEELQNSEFFAVMDDETTDVSNVEQVVMCLRWVN